MSVVVDYEVWSCDVNSSTLFESYRNARALALTSSSLGYFRSEKVKLPEWVDIVKTNVAKELAPYDEDWYYTRLASLARHIYVRSPVGVSTVCKIYGGKTFLNTQRCSSPGLVRHMLGVIEHNRQGMCEKIDGF